MKTVLFAWEIGRGMGHVAAMLRFALRIERHGFRMIAAVKDTASAAALTDAGMEVVQTPPWPLSRMSDAQRAVLPSVTMCDGLAAMGLADGPALSALLAEWNCLFAKFKPDLVVVDFAPAASLAARGRIPLLLTGNGYTLPPSEMLHFPRLHQYSEPAWNESAVLDIVNKALRSFNGHQLHRMPQLFSSDARVIWTLPFLDPYAAQRSEPADGPIFEERPLAKAGNADEILVYLSRGYKIHPHIAGALAPFGDRVRIYAPELTGSQRDQLSQAGAHVHDHPLRMFQALTQSCLVIHQGGPGVAAEAIVAGVPQFVLAQHIEQELNGLALEKEGIGKMVRAYDPNTTVTSDDIGALMLNTASSTRAEQIGARHRDLLKTCDPLGKFERECLRLLGA